MQLAAGVYRPLMVTWAGDVEVGLRNTPTASPEHVHVEPRVSGLVVCEPEDYHTPALRGEFQRSGDPARLTGQPSRQFPFCYGETLAEGPGIGQWTRRKG